jgi:hypothetical protein
MNKNKFNKLKKENGTKVVWKDEDGYHFSMGEELMDLSEDEELDEYDRIQAACEKVPEIDFAIAMGDDTVHCISVKELSDVDKVDGLEIFIENYVGRNCYS